MGRSGLTATQPELFQCVCFVHPLHHAQLPPGLFGFHSECFNTTVKAVCFFFLNQFEQQQKIHCCHHDRTILELFFAGQLIQIRNGGLPVLYSDPPYCRGATSILSMMLIFILT